MHKIHVHDIEGRQNETFLALCDTLPDSLPAFLVERLNGENARMICEIDPLAVPKPRYRVLQTEEIDQLPDLPPSQWTIEGVPVYWI